MLFGCVHWQMPLPWPPQQITFKPPNLVQVLNPPKKQPASCGEELSGEGER